MPAISNSIAWIAYPQSGPASFKTSSIDRDISVHRISGVLALSSSHDFEKRDHEKEMGHVMISTQNDHAEEYASYVLLPMLLLVAISLFLRKSFMP
jgi:hypothetical protein